MRVLALLPDLSPTMQCSSVYGQVADPRQKPLFNPTVIIGLSDSLINRERVAMSTVAFDAFDAFEYAHELRAAGITEQQAEIFAKSTNKIVRIAAEAAKEEVHVGDLATKRDLKEVELTFKHDLKELELNFR
jgi:hypothetical protein